MAEKKTEFRADPLPDKLHCKRQKYKENASKMNRFPQQISFPSKTKKPCVIVGLFPGVFVEITDP
jgi:hypothetical protein